MRPHCPSDTIQSTSTSQPHLCLPFSDNEIEYCLLYSVQLFEHFIYDKRQNDTGVKYLLDEQRDLHFSNRSEHS